MSEVPKCHIDEPPASDRPYDLCHSSMRAGEPIKYVPNPQTYKDWLALQALTNSGNTTETYPKYVMGNTHVKFGDPRGKDPGYTIAEALGEPPFSDTARRFVQKEFTIGPNGELHRFGKPYTFYNGD